MIAVDIEMPDEGPPTIAYARDVFAFHPVFTLAIPPGGGEEDARLFASVVDRREAKPDGVFHEGARPIALPYQGFVVEPVDPDIVPRLLERGCHPGDFEIAGRPADRYGRAPIAVLTVMNLATGLSNFDRLSLPPEMRFALAEAFAQLDGSWSKAADLLDPASLVRSGAVDPLGGNPLTLEGHHRSMIEHAEAQFEASGVDRHPMVDFRSFDAEELAYEIRMDARAIVSARPDLAKSGQAYDLFSKHLQELADRVQDGRVSPGDIVVAFAKRDAVLAEFEPAVVQLAGGRGAGALCWRNLFEHDGLLQTAMDRALKPGCHDDPIARVAALPDWARKAFRDPPSLVRNTVGRLDQLRQRLTDRHRPYCSMALRRILASPGLKAGLSELDDDRLRTLLEGNRLMAEAYDGIANRHPQVPQARDGLALGWRILAAEHLRRWPDRLSIMDDDLGLPIAAAALPYVDELRLRSGPSFGNVGRRP